MAVGFSGSNGGITKNYKSFTLGKDPASGPIEFSYFVNNVCNLACRHCYVGYLQPRGALSAEEWKNIFDQAKDLGALTFGNVGKEPLLAWQKSLELLRYLKEKRKESPRIRYGLVTNATLFNEKKIEELIDSDPAYLDVSIDGTDEVHDSIRGQGNYEKSVHAIRRIFDRSPELVDRLFISSTIMGRNKDINGIRSMISSLQDIGVRKFLLSTYVTSVNESGEDIGITREQVVDTYRTLKDEANSWLGKEDELYLKVDFDTQKPLIDLLVEEGVIELDKLLIDEYATIFNKEGKVFLNYIPAARTLKRDIRVSHDGFVGSCYDMFFEDYQKRVGERNVRLKTLKDILLENNNQHL